MGQPGTRLPEAQAHAGRPADRRFGEPDQSQTHGTRNQSQPLARERVEAKAAADRASYEKEKARSQSRTGYEDITMTDTGHPPPLPADPSTKTAPLASATKPTPLQHKSSLRHKSYRPLIIEGQYHAISRTLRCSRVIIRGRPRRLSNPHPITETTLPPLGQSTRHNDTDMGRWNSLLRRPLGAASATSGTSGNRTAPPQPTPLYHGENVSLCHRTNAGRLELLEGGRGAFDTPTYVDPVVPCLWPEQRMWAYEHSRPPSYRTGKTLDTGLCIQRIHCIHRRYEHFCIDTPGHKDPMTGHALSEHNNDTSPMSIRHLPAPGPSPWPLAPC